MATVLAFGDSLTWGRRADAALRHARADRWPEALAAGLAGVEVVTEGLRGRMTAFDQTAAPADMNGARLLPAILHSHAPIDLVIVMLGTNDIYFGLPPERVGDGLRRIVEVIRGHAWRMDEDVAPDILLIAPPPMLTDCAPDVTVRKVRHSAELAAVVRDVAETMETGFFDAATVSSASPDDGIHMDAANTRRLGESLREPVRKMLADREKRAKL